jgi:hypothetical protein
LLSAFDSFQRGSLNPNIGFESHLGFGQEIA